MVLQRMMQGNYLNLVKSFGEKENDYFQLRYTTSVLSEAANSDLFVSEWWF